MGILKNLLANFPLTGKVNSSTKLAPKPTHSTNSPRQNSIINHSSINNLSDKFEKTPKNFPSSEEYFQAFTPIPLQSMENIPYLEEKIKILFAKLEHMKNFKPTINQKHIDLLQARLNSLLGDLNTLNLRNLNFKNYVKKYNQILVLTKEIYE